MWHRQSFYRSRDRRPLVNAYEKRIKKHTHTSQQFLAKESVTPQQCRWAPLTKRACKKSRIGVRSQSAPANLLQQLRWIVSTRSHFLGDDDQTNRGFYWYQFLSRIGVLWLVGKSEKRRGEEEWVAMAMRCAGREAAGRLQQQRVQCWWWWSCCHNLS